MSLLEQRESRGFVSAGISAKLMRCIEFLDDQDRQLIEMSLAGRVTRREAGLLMGLAGGSVSRRIQRILARLANPTSVALVELGESLDESHRDIGLDFFLRGHSIRRITIDRSMTRHKVIAAITFIEGWARGKR